MKKEINLNEEQLRTIIQECVKNILSENMENEGVWDNIKGAFQGAKNGFNASKSLDATDKANRYKFDKYDPSTGLKGENEYNKNAAIEAEKMYKMAKQYQSMAAKLYSRANALAKYANLEKTGQGKEVSFKYKDIHSVPSTVNNLNTRRLQTKQKYA